MGWFGKKQNFLMSFLNSLRDDDDEVKLTPREEGEAKLKNAVGAIYAIAILTALAGAITLIFQIETLLASGTGLVVLIASIIYSGLGFWVQKKRSVIGLGLAFGLYIADGVAFVINNIEAGGSPTAGIALRVAIAYVMFQGFSGIQQLKSAKTDDGPDDSTDADTDTNADANPDPTA